ncbi:sensor histidine kinase [Arcanobacterium ihumii]|uniref:sensor histidine kinase n=1 Tax=Arcanobacterium ihumii TaxID=2138162 RepID=UPI000F54A03C|nr:ATP-binding protein [Arcanobacterium ihumii]
MKWRKKRRVNAHALASQIEELSRSRREIVDAFEIERRRIERDLHDGAQQYIVASGMAIGEAQLVLDSTTNLPPELADLPGILERAKNSSQLGLKALRATVNGIHPKILSDRGLEAAVRDVAERTPVPVNVVVPHPLPRLPEGVIAAAYFLVTEALTNVAKHEPEAEASVLLTVSDSLRISVVDTGRGGAKIVEGGGLAGLRERLAAFGGTLEVSSPSEGPTTVSASLPLLLFRGESGINTSEMGFVE